MMTMMKNKTNCPSEADIGVRGKIVESKPEEYPSKIKRKNKIPNVNLNKGDVVGLKDKNLRVFLTNQFGITEFIGTINAIVNIQNNKLYIVSIFAPSGKEILIDCAYHHLEIKR